MPDRLEECPYCRYPACEADWVDVGVGEVQCGPYYCPECQASEIGPYDNVAGLECLIGPRDDDEPRPAPRVLTHREILTHWYEPYSPVSDKANTFQGVPVSHRTAKSLYDRGLLDPKP